MKTLVRFLVVLSLWTTAVTLQGQSNSPDNFVLQKTTEVPGTKLRAGDYKIVILDSLTDRVVMQVNSADGKAPTLILGVPGHLAGTSGQPVFWDAKEQGKHALRGFVFADGRSVEFVYPKADAVALAKANHTSVVAVDPASEGRPELGRLSSRDMQMVNLWLLTPTRVSGQDALEAKHLEPSGTTATKPLQTAQSSTPALGGTTAPSQMHDPAGTAMASDRQSSRSFPKQVTAPRVKSKPVPSSHTLRASADIPAGLHRLPQTASTLPLWFLLTTTCLAGAAAFRVRRTTEEAA